MSAKCPSLDAQRWPVGLCRPGCVTQKQRLVPPVTPMGTSQDRAGTRCQQAHAEEPQRNSGGTGASRGASAAGGSHRHLGHAEKPALQHHPSAPCADLSSVRTAADGFGYHVDPREGQGSLREPWSVTDTSERAPGHPCRHDRREPSQDTTVIV